MASAIAHEGGHVNAIVAMSLAIGVGLHAIDASRHTLATTAGHTVTRPLLVEGGAHASPPSSATARCPSLGPLALRV